MKKQKPDSQAMNGNDEHEPTVALMRHANAFMIDLILVSLFLLALFGQD